MKLTLKELILLGYMVCSDQVKTVDTDEETVQKALNATYGITDKSTIDEKEKAQSIFMQDLQKQYNHLISNLQKSEGI